MVKSINKCKYICPYCGDEYDNYSEAEDCRDNCEEPKDVITMYNANDMYECELCNMQYDIYSEAEKCEAKHLDDEDKYYDQYKKEQLSLAAAHPNQMRLI